MREFARLRASGSFHLLLPTSFPVPVPLPIKDDRAPERPWVNTRFFCLLVRENKGLAKRQQQPRPLPPCIAGLDPLPMRDSRNKTEQ